MLSVVQYLEYHGLRPEHVRGFIRELGDGESLLLVGSVAEGLANIESDLDLLLLEGDEDDQSDSRGNLLREMPEGFDVNVEILTPRDVEMLGRRFVRSFDQLGGAAGGSEPRAIRFISPDDLRLLHRLYTGLPLLGTGFDRIRERYALHRLADLCLLQQAACHLRLRADAEQAVRDESDPHTGLLMTQLAAQHLLGSVLASIGETNPTTKWLVRLANDHRNRLHHVDTAEIVDLALNLTGASARTAAARLASVSERTLTSLIKATERSDRSLGDALRALATRQADIELVGA